MKTKFEVGYFLSRRYTTLGTKLHKCNDMLFGVGSYSIFHISVSTSSASRMRNSRTPKRSSRCSVLSRARADRQQRVWQAVLSFKHISWYQEIISWYHEIEFLISRIQFLISRITIALQRKIISWYQEFNSWYHEYAFLISRIHFLISSNRIRDIKNWILDIKKWFYVVNQW